MGKDFHKIIVGMVHDAFLAEGIDPSFAIITKTSFPYVDFHTANMISAAKSMGLEVQELSDRIISRLKKVENNKNIVK